MHVHACMCVNTQALSSTLTLVRCHSSGSFGYKFHRSWVWSLAVIITYSRKHWQIHLYNMYVLIGGEKCGEWPYSGKWILLCNSINLRKKTLTICRGFTKFTITTWYGCTKRTAVPCSNMYQHQPFFSGIRIGLLCYTNTKNWLCR